MQYDLVVGNQGAASSQCFFLTNRSGLYGNIRERIEKGLSVTPTLLKVGTKVARGEVDHLQIFEYTCRLFLPE